MRLLGCTLPHTIYFQSHRNVFCRHDVHDNALFLIAEQVPTFYPLSKFSSTNPLVRKSCSKSACAPIPSTSTMASTSSVILVGIDNIEPFGYVFMLEFL